MGRSDVLPFWFGEPDAVTASFIRDAAHRALEAGDTFYHHNLGSEPLRQALSAYLSARHQPVSADRVAITSSGVNAIMLAAQTVVSPGDRVVAVVPLWPNVTEIPAILGARVHRVGLRFAAPDATGARWHLDIEELLEALTPDTTMLILNSPSNPTGWVMGSDPMARVLAHCRERGIWILSDEAYERLVFDGSRQAPSFLDVAADDDRLIVANTFSKAWQMTGWRLGWLVLPASLAADVAKLIEYNTSCAPGFVQAGALVAVRDGEPLVHSFVDELQTRRDTLVQALREIPGVSCDVPAGAMYLFFSLEGERDSLALAKHLVRDAGIGLAPGSAFGPEGEGFLRWCFARPVEQLRSAAERLAGTLAGR